MQDRLSRYQATDSTDGICEIDISSQTVSEALKGLKHGKSYVLDRIPNEFLRFGGKDMTDSIVSLFNMCATLECFPAEWHRGIIKPLHQSGDMGTLSNYRGIEYNYFQRVQTCCLYCGKTSGAVF